MRVDMDVDVICSSNKRERPHLMLNLRLISIRLELSKFSLNFDLLRDFAHIWCGYSPRGQTNEDPHTHTQTLTHLSQYLIQ